MKKPRKTRKTPLFFRTVLRSVTDIRFFREAREKKVSDAIGYLAVLLILTWLIPFTVQFFVGARAVNEAVVSGVRLHVPADATFTMRGGIFTNDLEEPIDVTQNGLRIIVNSASSALSLSEDEVGIAVNRDAIVQQESRDRVQVIGYSDFPDFEFDRAKADDWIAAAGPWIVLIVSVVAIFTFALALAIGFGTYVVVHAFALSLGLRIMKRPLPYGRAFVVMAYAATFPIIIKALADWSGTDIGSAPTFLYWIILAFILYDFRKEVAHGHETQKSETPDRPPEDSGGRG